MAKRQLLINLLLLLATFFVVVFGVVRVYAMINVESENFEMGKKEDEALRKLLQVENQLKARRAQLIENGKQFNIAVPLEQDVPTLLAELDSIAASKSMVLDSISLGSVSAVEGTQVGNVKALHFKINLTGLYGYFKDFLTELETNIPLINVEQYSFTPIITEAGTFGLTSFNVDATTYFITTSNNE
ncbi:MAG: hypothetical protein UY09_C0020G0005 [Parcubacteria group bacterium GW2011_GWA2_47_8]|nr:MAG: hypothetical protein UY09_C0020G0005 [Parcubacteria group bacterium GW2011_GWA2_47_8]